MSRSTFAAVAAACAIILAPSTTLAQGKPVLHIDHRWEECSFKLHPNLTQSAWRQFSREAGLVTYFRPLADARPLGARNYELSLVQWETAIDASDPAWNDTFVHPDSAHWLFEGNGLKFPGLMARVGLTGSTDAGLYVTKSPGANYGFYGAQLQQSLVRGAREDWAGAARVSFVSMYGPEDLTFSVYGLDLVASRRYGVLSDRVSISPYAGVSASLSRAHERTTAVNLADENVWGAQGMIGAVAQVGPARVAAEYGIAGVRSLSLKVGFGSRGN